MISLFRFTLLFSLIALLFGCEKEFTPPDVEPEPQIVVEGYVEAAGDQSSPPYVILTRTLPFFSTLDSSQFADFYVHDAVVTVDDGDQIVALTEICLADLSPAQLALAEGFLGGNIDSRANSFCVYLDPGLQMFGQEGRSYDLRVEVENEVLTASTTIPAHVPLDSLYFVEPPGEDTRPDLAQMQVGITDPPGRNFYRYFVGINGGSFRRDDFSVLEDAFFDDRAIVFPLNRPLPDTSDFDLSTFGLFTIGDTAKVKWVTFDEASFNFWNTIEFASANQGPFSNYTIIDSNVEGGLGIWSGRSASYYESIVELKE
ncbi:hypothetical protein CEQ90_00055 [Lewinellaceae bacterium SD302]|nr:hypothetical protein CEQ90_00055 [Lewinellaceae bacterium SD302]